MERTRVGVSSGGRLRAFEGAVALITGGASRISPAPTARAFVRMRAALYAPDDPDVAATPPD
jgi:hypothetical protein